MIFTQSEPTASLRRFYLYLVDATDGITPETGEAGGQPQVSKAGGAPANTSGTLVAIGNGQYYVELTATELNTLGAGSVRYKSAATAEFSAPFQVVVPSLSTSGTGFPAVDASNRVDVGEIMGVVLTLSSNVVTIPAGLSLAPTTNTVSALRLAGAPNGYALDIAGGGYEALADSSKGAIRVAMFSDGGVDTPLIEIQKGATSTTAITSNGTIDANIVGNITGTLSTVTNLTNLPSIPANWLTAAGTASDFGTEIGTAVWATTTRVLTAGTNIALAKGTGVTGFNDLDAAGIRSATGQASANLDTNLAVIAAYVDTLETRIPATINVTDLNNTTTRFLTMIVLDGAVYQYTANALELGPAGGSGSADWTADERTAIRAILGVPGSGTTPETPSTGALATLLNRIGAFTGTGVNTVLGFFKALMSKTASTPSDVGGTFSAATDSTEAIRDAMAAGTGDASQATLELVKAKTDLIQAGRITVGPAIDPAGQLTIQAGDDYLDAIGRALTWAITDYSGPSLSGGTASLSLIDLDAFNTAAGTVDLELAGTVSVSGTTVTVKVDATATQTATLTVSPPAKPWMYRYQLVGITSGGKRVTLQTGAATVRRQIDA